MYASVPAPLIIRLTGLVIRLKKEKEKKVLPGALLTDRWVCKRLLHQSPWLCHIHKRLDSWTVGKAKLVYSPCNVSLKTLCALLAYRIKWSKVGEVKLRQHFILLCLMLERPDNISELLNATRTTKKRRNASIPSKPEDHFVRVASQYWRNYQRVCLPA